jgi:hypothetical protein
LSIERASDVFYGEQSMVTRKVQYARGLKMEIQLPWLDRRPVSVGSRNLHRDLFTTAFGRVPNCPRRTPAASRSAFERLLLTLLAGPAGGDSDRLLEGIRQAMGRHEVPPV